MYAIPITGGEIEGINLDTSRVPEMDQFVGVEEYDGKLYVLMWDGNTYPPSALCEWAEETGALVPVATTDGTFTATGFLVDGDTYFLFAGAEIISGELPN